MAYLSVRAGVKNKENIIPCLLLKFDIAPALSLGIGCLIIWSSLGIIRETLNILLEGTPRGLSVEQIVSSLTAIDGVNDVHDVHVWSISSDSHALSCHVRIADMPLSESENILRQVTDLLASRFHIHHTTIQFENALCTIPHGCVIPIGVPAERQEEAQG